MQILRQLVQSTALAVEALRAYADEHLVALTLQRSFLPAVLPETPGITICVRYAPASDQAEVRGDFYEALEWQGRLLVAIGDVQGHSLHAATVMGELRHALRAFAGEGHRPPAIAGLVNKVLQRYHPAAADRRRPGGLPRAGRNAAGRAGRLCPCRAGGPAAGRHPPDAHRRPG